MSSVCGHVYASRRHQASTRLVDNAACVYTISGGAETWSVSVRQEGLSFFFEALGLAFITRQPLARGADQEGLSRESNIDMPSDQFHIVQISWPESGNA